MLLRCLWSLCTKSFSKVKYKGDILALGIECPIDLTTSAAQREFKMLVPASRGQGVEFTTHH